jgi:hypothetical protein
MTRFLTLTAILGVLNLPGMMPAVQAQEPVNVTVTEDVYTADLQLPGGASAKLTVTFEDVVGLSPLSLGVSAIQVNPLDPTLLRRLGKAVGGVPAAFPMLVRIEPDPVHGLSFSGTVTVELYTHDLEFAVGSPLRLFSAPAGGAFRDITVLNHAGSYRSGGTKGNFSEFIIAIDTRPPTAAAADKLQYLRTLLDSHAPSMDVAVYDELSSLLAGVETAFAATSLVTAITRVEAFADAVTNHSGSIPHVWSATQNLENVAGQLRAAAGTLRFSLTLATNSS